MPTILYKIMELVMNQYKTSAELKSLAKESLLGKYGVAVCATLLYILIIYITSSVSSIFLLIPGLVGTLLYYLSTFAISVFTGLFFFGFNYIFLKISCNVPAKASDLYYGFKGPFKEILKIQLFRSILSYVACVPMYVFNELVPEDQLVNYIGIYALLFGFGLLVQFILMLLYNQAFYILLDFPNYDAKKALVFSRELMKGNKGRVIYLLVSFIPLSFLGILSCGIGFLWIIPYMQTTLAQFYLDLIQNKN